MYSLPCPASALSDKQSYNPLLQLAFTIPTSAESGVPKPHKDTTIHMKIRTNQLTVAPGGRQASKERDRIAFKTSEGVARGLCCTPDELVIKKYRDLSQSTVARRSLRRSTANGLLERTGGSAIPKSLHVQVTSDAKINHKYQVHIMAPGLIDFRVTKGTGRQARIVCALSGVAHPPTTTSHSSLIDSRGRGGRPAQPSPACPP
ncbi:hypothetical protein Pcinc_033104 [Petrolisthes cinctipes]|uniref:Uncharacterized protein n=1 Tax=Petrolisthes cinctipes TaxID=88211 RepID=A0AAE1K023_PETCI|nr:hypothetical protein Pcinc_033104 [Petrolisthes cinctipes]